MGAKNMCTFGQQLARRPGWGGCGQMPVLLPGVGRHRQHGQSVTSVGGVAEAVPSIRITKPPGRSPAQLALEGGGVQQGQLHARAAEAGTARNQSAQASADPRLLQHIEQMGAYTALAGWRIDGVILAHGHLQWQWTVGIPISVAGGIAHSANALLAGHASRMAGHATPACCGRGKLFECSEHESKPDRHTVMLQVHER